MQVLAAYFLETNPLTQQAAAERSLAISTAVQNWLSTKGVSDPSLDKGTFVSLTAGSKGVFTRRTVTADIGTLEEAHLEETSRGGQMFTTSIYRVASSTKVAVYATLSVTNTVAVITPAATDPRCPAVIRELLEKYPDWLLGNHPLGKPHPRRYLGAAGAEELLNEITSGTRSIPVVVVSELEGETIWRSLPKDLAFDLAGLAHVAVIDDEASWKLTADLGKRNSCYSGAIRLYWPMKNIMPGDSICPSTVWTASALLSNDHDGNGIKRFRSIVRRTAMSTAALTVDQPRVIRDIQGFPARKRLQDLEARAADNSEELQIARLYLSDNEQLKSELADAKNVISQLNKRAESAEFALEQMKVKVGSLQNDITEEDGSAPNSGDVRFYKKIRSTPSHDVLVRVINCGHAVWQAAAKADKAKKGLEKLEGRNDWKAMHHCGTCTGGGMWKIRW